jgi:uncharacterized Zn-binding protein involved in type VI secretion
VLVGGAAAARVGDFATDPRLDGFTPCLGGQIVTGSASVLIGGKPAGSGQRPDRAYHGHLRCRRDRGGIGYRPHR